MLSAGVVVDAHAATNLASIGAQMSAARNAAAASGRVNLGVSSQQALQISQPSIQNLAHAAQGLAQQMAAQQAAAAAAMNTASNVPNGLTPGGLQVAPGVSGNTGNPALWLNANAPTQSVDSSGHVNVDVKQTAQKAVLTWQTMNVGRQTTLNFDQSAGAQSSGANDWIVFNRIQDPNGAPSQILGNIKAQGSVYVINRNGIIFGAGSQVNVHSLLVSSLDLFSSDSVASNAFFLQNGIGQTTDPNHILTQNPTINGFLVNGVNADGTTTGAITIEQGASITAGAQGYALLAAPNVSNAGSIVADDGQVFMVANGQVGYVASTTGDGRFSVDGGVADNSGLPGTVLNTGLVEARRGNIEWFGNQLVQNGVVAVSTSLSEPGSISFDSYGINSGKPGGTAQTGTGTVSLGEGSVTTVLPDEDGGTTTSGAAADAAFKTGSVTMSGNAITLNGGALIEAPGANVSLTANATNAGPGRIYLDDGAVIDVSGLADVELPMSALLVTIPRIGQNELADSPLQRNGFLFGQQDLVIDSTQSGTRADGLDWIGSPILNVAGYVENVPRSIDQLLTTGGNITLAGDQVIARTGSQMLLNGGYVAYQPGWVTTPNLLGANGRIYSIDNADPEMTYVGFAGEFTETHARWGVTKTWYNPLLSGFSRWDSGFIQGYDAGTLTIEPSFTSLQSILDGSISAQALTGRNQAQNGDAPQGGSLVIANINLSQQPAEIGGTANAINFVISNQPVSLEDWQPGFTADTPLTDTRSGNFSDPGDPFYWRTLSASMLDNAGFSSIELESGGTIRVDSGTTLSVQPGGSIALTAPALDIEGTLRAPSGSLMLNSFAGVANFSGTTNVVIPPQTLSSIVVGPTGVLDASGQFVNDSEPTDGRLVGREFVDGGSITLSAWKGGTAGSPDFTGNIDLQTGSVLDVSGGGYVASDGQLAMQNGVPVGKGGDIAIGTHDDGVTNYVTGGGASTSAPANLLGGQIMLDGTLLSYGFSGGGTLSLHAPQIQIGGTPAPTSDASLLYLSPDFFQGQGFSRYQLTADTDATIAPGTIVQVQPSFLLPNIQALVTAPTGTRLDPTGTVPATMYAKAGTLDPYRRWLLDGNNAGFSLSAGGYLGWNPPVSVSNMLAAYTGVNGSLVLGQGAAIDVDPGAAVMLSAANQLTVLGSISAPGGAIALNNLTASKRAGTGQADSIWLGSDSVLDAAGVVLTNLLAAPVRSASGQSEVPVTGAVLAGGTVTLNSNGYLLAQSGATIDVSGTQSVFDLPSAGQGLGLTGGGYVPTPVWSNAGGIVLAAGAGMLFDATLQAQAGAPQADGGSLTIAGLIPASTTSQQPQAIELQTSGNLLPMDLTPGEAVEPGLSKPSGILHFAMDRLDGSGITSLTIGPAPVPGANTTNGNYAVVPLLFAGDVDIEVGRSVIANASSYVAVPAGATVVPTASVAGAGTVSISAPYVYIAGTLTGTATPASLAGDGTLDVQAGFLDIGGRVQLKGFAQANFASSGDLRFYLPGNDVYGGNQQQTGWLYTNGDLAFTASRIYPVSDYSFLIDAVPQTGGQTTVSFSNSGTPDNSTPLSAGGTLAVAASQIVQGGTLWVPSGSILLGVSDASSELSGLGLASTFPLPATQSVELTKGSVTSVSLDGATIPFGSTTDGTDWRYDANPISAQPDLTVPPAKEIVIGGVSVSLEAGATVDVSGGGDLQAREWVAGTGGTRDVLAQTETNTDGITSPQYADGRAIYAIVPGYSAPVGAYDAAMANGTGAGAGPAVGQAVYLSGVPGLPAGIYTLLPAGYATLKGAYRVVQNAGTGAVVPGASMTQPDGTAVVSGYFTDGLTGARGAETSFQVQSGPVWQQYSQYTLSSANSYFAAQAQHAGTVTPPLPEDAGHLELEASGALALNTTLTATTGTGGRGAEVDIGGEAIQIVSPGESGLTGYLQLDADGLTNLGAASLLIGGTRTAGDDGDLIDATANGVVLSNDAAHPLSGPEVILVTNGLGSGIDLQAGSVLEATGTLTGADAVPLVIGSAAVTSTANGTTTVTTPAVSGDGALVRVANGPTAPVSRADVTGIDGPAGVAGGALTIAAGAVLDGGQSLSLDATGNTQVDPDALLSAQAIDITANRISFVSGAGGTGTQSLTGLEIGPATLAQFGQTDSLILRSRSTIDFIGDISANFGQSLTLDAAALTSDGGTVNVNADTLVLANDLTGNTAASFAAGSGTLNLNAGELDFGSGVLTLQGFGAVSAQASRGIAAQGSGSVDFGNLDVSLNAPIVLAGTGADLNLTTTGTLNLGSAAGTALTREALGGTLTLTGSAVNIGTDVLAPGGTLTVNATSGNLTIGDGAQLSVAGLPKAFDNISAYVPGGTLTLEASGDIDAAAGSTLDVSGDVAGGNAGRLVVESTSGTAKLQGQLLGSAAAGYLGGNLVLQTGGALDLDSLSDSLAAGGMNGTMMIQTGAGDLTLDAGHTLTAHGITLVADGGTAGPDGGMVRINGTVDASGTFGSPVSLYGQGGVDVEGSVLTDATALGQIGGDLTLGTNGLGDGTLNGPYGYENVQAGGSGTITIGAGASLNLSGPAGNGSLALRAPLLANGDVNVNIDSGAKLTGVAGVSLEAYATWSTDDPVSSDPATAGKHFDGIIDPAGWYDSTGTLVPGTWADANGNPVAAPDSSNSQQVAQYLAEYYFTPSSTAVDAAHQTFYGYVNDDASQGPGTLMGFVEAPGFTFKSRFAALPDFHAVPGVQLVNPDANVNGGNISVLTNWNLGAGTTNADGSVNLAYRYEGEAPALTVRAENNLVIDASLTDGFFQYTSTIAPAAPSYQEASADYAQVMDQALFYAVGEPIPNDMFTQPADLDNGGQDPTLVSEYYGQYIAYADYLLKATSLADTGYGNSPVAYITSLIFGTAGPVSGTPAAPPPPANLSGYPAYLSTYANYLFALATKVDYPDDGGLMPDGTAILQAPPTVLAPITPVTPVTVLTDNSPSPQNTVADPLPLLSATLMGGSSSRYRLVAGSDLNSADPLSVQTAPAGGASGEVTLDGQTDFMSGRMIYAPTLVRTGTGSIDIVAAGDIKWLDDEAPAAIYTAGAPAPGTTATATTGTVTPSSGLAGYVTTGAVNPAGAGNITLSAGGDIDGIEQVVDQSGAVTGTAGTLMSQYWWQWMETGNASDGSRSSINFGAFDQGVMSVGGNVDVSAGGNIRDLSVSLPTTWYANADGTSVTTVGGGNLSVRAGGEVLSGAYFVAGGSGTISAGGSIVPDITDTFTIGPVAEHDTITTPVATLLAMQDATLQVQADGSVNIGGVYNPSWIDSTTLDTFLPAKHADGQSYSATSSLSVLATGGDLTYGSLSVPISLFVPPSNSGILNQKETAGNVLPATVSFIATAGNIDIRAAGELYPSATGNLDLLADGSISFVNGQYVQESQGNVWGLIDAPASTLPSPLDTIGLTAGADIEVYGQTRHGGYIEPGSSTAFLTQAGLHADDSTPVRITALTGDIVDGAGFGAGAGNLWISPDKPALVEAGNDIIDLAFIGQQTHASDVTLIEAGRDIIDTPLVASPTQSFTPDPALVAAGPGLLPVIIESGLGTLVVQAGRDIGPLSNRAEYASFAASNDQGLPLPGSSLLTGIDTVGNQLNPHLPADGASVQVMFGVGPGIDQAAFVARYVDPSAGVAGVPSFTPALIDFMESYEEGLSVDTGLSSDAVTVNLTSAQAWTAFQALPAYVQQLFVDKALFNVLTDVGADYNNPASPFFHQYARGYAAISTLFPASLGYTDNGSGQGGINGAQQTADTGDLDMRSSTIQTQRGGTIDILGPGGQALIGSTAAPAQITNASGKVVAGPNTMGILTLEQGDIDIFTDRSVLLAQSRIFTEQGGGITIWSSNGDINAGQGAKTTTELATDTYLCTIDAWCQLNASGEVSGAGIGTLQTIPDAPVGDAYLMAPRGTVDAGDAGIRVSGNLYVAAAQVLNADNIQVQGKSTGVPIVASVDTGALTAATSAASAVTQMAQNIVRNNASGVPQRHWIITVQIEGFGDSGDDGDRKRHKAEPISYDPGSAVSVLGLGGVGNTQRSFLTKEEQRKLVSGGKI